jgi:hypothetical protein
MASTGDGKKDGGGEKRFRGKTTAEWKAHRKANKRVVHVPDDWDMSLLTDVMNGKSQALE